MSEIAFYPCNTMLAQIPAMTLCPSVSVHHKSMFETAERIKLVFGMEDSFDLSYMAF